MIHLYVTLRDRAVGHFEIPGDKVRIGRHPDNEVQIDSMAVSRHHCVLDRTPAGGWVVEDLGSNNGTYVNGARVQGKAPVRDGDVLGIGKFQVSFQSSPSTESRGLRPAPEADSPELREHAAPIKGFLVLLNRPGAPIPLERDAFVIGDAAGVDLRNAGPARQAVIVRGFGGFQVLDVGPAAGQVRVGTRTVADRAWLKDGDVITVGELELELHLGLPHEDQSTMNLDVPAGGFKPPPGFPG
jgi:predicted component of type VI protein secretion system